MRYQASCVAALSGLFLLPWAGGYDVAVHTQTAAVPRLSVKLVDDFEVTGLGDRPAWQQTEWTPLRRRQPDGHPYDARFKMLYSTTGLYLWGTDRKLTATGETSDLWNEDVFEAFSDGRALPEKLSMNRSITSPDPCPFRRRFWMAPPALSDRRAQGY